MTSAISWQPVQKITEFQSKSLAEVLKYVQSNSPYYKDLFKQAKINVEAFTGLSDLEKIPTTSKNDFSNRNFDFLCVDKTKVIDYTSTSGTTGQPVTIALTEADLQRLAYNEEQSFICANGKPTDLYQLMVTIDRQFMAGMAYFEGIRMLGAGMIRIGPASPKTQWDAINRYKPNTIVAVPSFILKLIEYAELNGIDLADAGIEKAICIGEPLRNANLTPNELTKRINGKWDIQLFSTYASTEMQTAFTECAHSKGGHLQPDLMIVEILDDAGNAVAPGQFGEVTITTLGVEGMPLVRYRTGDICCLYTEPCQCGRNSPRLSPVIGRKNQMIKYNGTTFFPASIYNALQTVPEVSEYFVEVTKNEISNDEITIHISHIGDRDLVETAIKTSLKAMIRAQPVLNFVTAQQIQQLKATESRKPASIIFK